MNKRNSGITLVALVITIIILLIMAGVSIALVVGDNGVLSKAKEAKTGSIVAEEKEQVNLAYSSALTKNLGVTVTAENLQDELDLSVGANKTTVTVDGNSLNVLFNETGHSYNVNNGRVGNGTGGETGLSDAEKLKQFYLANNYNGYIGPYVDDTPYEVDGKEVWFIDWDKFIDWDNENPFGYVLYNGSIFQVEIDYNYPHSVTDVQFVKTSNIDLTTFGEYTDTIGTLEIKVLVTPSTPGNLVHGGYDGPTTAEDKCYYPKENADEPDFDRPFIGGYVTNDKGVEHCYDATGELTHIYCYSLICCFDAGSQVLMENGTTKSIEDVELGDMVMSLNEKTGEYVAQEVKECIIKHNSDDLVYVNLSNGTKIGMRAYHPLLTIDGWKSLRPNLAETTMEAGEEVKLLEVGDTLIGYSENVTVVSIDQRPEIENYDTYNLSIDGYHNYIVNGIVVHNAHCDPYYEYRYI